MWQPPERIRHEQLEARWPTEGEAAAALLFSPVAVGPVRLEQRTWVPAMVPWRATEDGFVTPDVLAWYERFARGRPGALVVEATGIRDVPSGPLLRVGDDRFVPGLAQLVEVVRTASGGRTRLFLQVIDFLSVRRRPDPAKYFERYLELNERHRRALAGQPSIAAAGGLPGTAQDDEIRRLIAGLPEDELSAVLDARELESLQRGHRERVTDVQLAHVRDLPISLPPAFGAAARRAEAAGFDGVELHYAHAYTMASFLSALNDRADGWGGTREGRVRLPLAVLAAVRAEVSAGFAVGCRYLSEDCVDGGSTVEDAEWFGVALARAGMDWLSLSRGGRFEDAQQPKVGEAVYPYTGPSGYECMPTVISDAAGPFGRNVDAATRVRAAVRAAGCTTPIVVAGGLATFDQAEGLLASGTADIIAAARQSLADPDWFLKLRLGRGADVRRCEFTNYCEALDQRHQPVTCKLWDRLARDTPGTPLTPDGRRRLLAPDWSP